MRIYRARAIRTVPPKPFDPLDSSGSVRGPLGWRFNDTKTEILYAAEVEALAVLEVTVRPGLDSILQILVAAIDVPDNAIVTLDELGITLPSNWNARPVAADSRSIAREFLTQVAALPAGAPRPMGVWVSSVLSLTNRNVLLDPSRRSEFRHSIVGRIPFRTLLATAS